jgi:hypothetical protein
VASPSRIGTPETTVLSSPLAGDCPRLDPISPLNRRLVFLPSGWGSWEGYTSPQQGSTSLGTGWDGQTHLATSSCLAPSD